MKGKNGVQAQVHPLFLGLLKEWQERRIALGYDSKAGENQLSIKRLTLTLYKYFKNSVDAYEKILHADIDKKET